jgi:catechol 2,3-dioxygenase-like lactoylglutathione lyase family enzyme
MSGRNPPARNQRDEAGVDGQDRGRDARTANNGTGSAMQYHVGRVIDHVHLKVRDIAASRGFYDAVLAALGLPPTEGGADYFHADELYVSPARTPTEPLTSGLHLAFQAVDRDAVHRFHAAALAAGGRDNGAPGERTYHPGYYAAFALDPDGNNIEAVHHGAMQRSAPSIVIMRVVEK